MYQRSTIPPAATTAPELAESWRRGLGGSWARIIHLSAFLPDSKRSFLLYMLGLAGISLGIVLHLLLSAQIMTAEVKMQSLALEYRMIDQQNMEIIWQTAQEASLEQVQLRAETLGYKFIPEKVYQLRRAGTTGSALPDVQRTAPPAVTAERLPTYGVKPVTDQSATGRFSATRAMFAERTGHGATALGERWSGWVDHIYDQLQTFRE